MVNKTAIEWTDYTSNPIKYRTPEGKPVWACVRKSPGCAHCYAADLAKRYGRGGAFTAEELAGYECYLDEKELRELLSVGKLPSGSKVFVGDMTDVFGEWVPFEYLDRLFVTMCQRPDVVFQILTKRPERMRAYFETYSATMLPGVRSKPSGIIGPYGEGLLIAPLPNVWLGTSVENQHWADIRVPELLATPAAVRFVSYEPALGPVDFKATMTDAYRAGYVGAWADWVIVGGESGPGARPFDVAWARSVVEQCRAAGVACFVKQMGSKPCFGAEPTGNFRDGDEYPGQRQYQLVATRLRLKDRKGGEMSEWPADLRVREWPGAADSVQRSAVSGVSS